MTSYKKYLWYVLRHKWFVFLECYKVGLIWEGIVHDLSKFLPDEFIPYARYFYGKDKIDVIENRSKIGYYKPTNTGDSAFEYAWFLHQKRNKHHWQYWVVPEKRKVTYELSDSAKEEYVDVAKAIEIPEKVAKEMVCDWRGAGRAQGTMDNNKLDWFERNKVKMKLHPDTELLIESILNFLVD